MTGVDGRVVGGRYRLVEPVGRGGMGRVWRGHDELLDRRVAVKEVLLPDGLAPEARHELVLRMMREARVAARLQHPGIVTVHDVVDDGDAPWVVMEFVAGRSLGAELTAEGRLPWRQVAAVGADIADALAHAHAAGVVHRDLKPDNVLLAGRRTVLTDFGIARVLDATTKLTRTNAVIGTPQYMAPEQIDGALTTPAGDMWSLGATLYAALEGNPPFDAPSLFALFHAIMSAPLRPAAHAGPLADVLAGMLAKDPAERPDAETVGAALRDALGGPAREAAP
ncbi:MAG: serine/threonine protein kinase, partial [Streptomyces sp.]|nr:serine/threonine protein kinase [Streptomyces sp.]